MIYKLVSSRRVISKIFADLNIKEEPTRISDIKEWIGEAMEKIGSVNQLIRKEKTLKVKGYQASMPGDLHRLNQVAYSINGHGRTWTPIKTNSSNFETNVYGRVPYPNESIVGEDHMVLCNELINVARLMYGKYPDDPMYDKFNRLTYEEALELINSDENVKTVLTNLLYKYKNGIDYRFYDGITYNMKPGYITLSVPSGFVKISYDAVAIDDRGYPLIPDLESYSEAVYWYVVMKMKYPEYLNGRMNREIYYDIRRSWNFYYKQAYAESLMPNHDDMEVVRGVWNRMIPLTNEGFLSSMRDISDNEDIYNQTN